MSMFLGPIHYWLYNKINNQEKLTAVIASEASKKGWISDAAAYTKELPALESVIDESNIHGWLQSQIMDAETRYASLIALLDDKFDEIRALAFEFGRENAVDAKADAEGIYKYFEDFFVNGMPCDHVNSVVAQGEDSLTWKMSQDIHAQYWNGGDTSKYYAIRKAVMDGMLEASEYALTEGDAFQYTIARK